MVRASVIDKTVSCKNKSSYSNFIIRIIFYIGSNPISPTKWESGEMANAITKELCNKNNNLKVLTAILLVV